jgi:hypothetical protein
MTRVFENLLDHAARRCIVVGDKHRKPERWFWLGSVNAPFRCALWFEHRFKTDIRSIVRSRATATRSSAVFRQHRPISFDPAKVWLRQCA